MNAMTTQKKEGALSKERAETQEYFLTPEVDIYEGKDEYVLKAEMPGVNKDGLELSLEGSVLTITGRRNSDIPKGALLHGESQPYGFRRVFELDPAIDTEKIHAKIEQGVLMLNLPKAERVKPRKISVTD